MLFRSVAGAPYAPCPTDAATWRRAQVQTTIDGVPVTVLPGLSHRNDSVPEVMRGEETQIFGAMRCDPSLAGGERLFALPGVTHCGGGIGLERFDALTALMDWVEKGNAPDRITASVNAANKEIPSEWSPARTRPLCPWPAFARYKGGDLEQESSFECVRP